MSPPAPAASSSTFYDLHFVLDDKRFFWRNPNHGVTLLDAGRDSAILWQTESGQGRRLWTDIAAVNIYVFAGSQRTTADPNKANARGKRIVHDAGGNLCNHDLALIVLDTNVEAPIAPVRLEATTQKGATFTAVGWGVTSTLLFPQVRQQRPGVRIEVLGPFLDQTRFLAVPDHEFETGESICSGDSGGPALDSLGRRGRRLRRRRRSTSSGSALR